MERGERLYAPDRCRSAVSRDFLDALAEPSSPSTDDLVRWLAAGRPVDPARASAPKSAVFVPLVSGDQRRRRDLAPEHRPRSRLRRGERPPARDPRRSLSVALENARLFDETKRLLTETDERAAELAIINSVQQGLASNLDMQAMYDLVGDKIQRDLRRAGRRHRHLRLRRGGRALPVHDRTWRALPGRVDPDREIAGLPGDSSSTASRSLIDDVDVWTRPAAVRQIADPVGEPSKSMLVAPLIVGDEIRAASRSRTSTATGAFTEADLRLLTTLAASLSVALENARLFDETKRLLAETDRRAAELAIVNSVQRGLAAQLDAQAMYELVGERASEVFDTQVVDIAIFDRRPELMQFAVLARARRPLPRTRRGRSWASASTSSRPGASSSSPNDLREGSLRLRASPQQLIRASLPGRRSSRRSLVGGEMLGVISPAEPRPRVRLRRVATCRCSPRWPRACSVALRDRPAHRRDAPPRRRAGDDQHASARR